MGNLLDEMRLVNVDNIVTRQWSDIIYGWSQTIYIYFGGITDTRHLTDANRYILRNFSLKEQSEDYTR